MRDHLIVVIPGVGGSVLAPPGTPDEPVWSVGWTDRKLLRDPGILALDNELEPVGLIRSFKPVPFWTAVTGYEGLLHSLGHPHPTVLPAPYDFRQGIEPAAKHVASLVHQRLAQLWPGQSHSRKVIVVSHSLGGLVARHWIGLGGGSEVCRQLITLGTPHLGAPKALDVLANGIRVKGFHVLPKLREVLRTWPSMAELLPRYQAVLDTRPASAGGSGGLLYPHELPLPWQKWGVDPEAVYHCHRSVETAWDTLPRSSTHVVPRIGYGHPTLRACTFDGGSVTVSRDAPHWPDLGKWEDELGDGTVPAYAGLPIEMRQSPDDFLVRYRHGRITTLDEVRVMVDRAEGRFEMWNIRGDVHPAALGLGVDEVQVAGDPVDVVAAIRGDSVRSDGVRVVWADVVEAVGGRRVARDIELVWDPGSGTFSGRTPSLPPGAYTVRARADAVPGAGDLECEQTIEVFDDGDLG